MISRARTLAGKSIDAMLASIEIYNKPSFAYREESFAIKEYSKNNAQFISKKRYLVCNLHC